MRSHRRQRCRGVTPPDPGGAWRLLASPLDNYRYAEAGNCSDDRCAGRSVPTRTNPQNRRLSSAELNIRIHFAPVASLERTALGSWASMQHVPMRNLMVTTLTSTSSVSGAARSSVSISNGADRTGTTAAVIFICALLKPVEDRFP